MKHSVMTNADAVSAGSQAQWVGSPSELTEEQWISVCAGRLIELRPSSERQAMLAVALDMSRTLRYFDPGLAAEMEHEGGMLDD